MENQWLRETCLTVPYLFASEKDEMVKRAFASIDMLDIATHVAHLGSSRMKKALMCSAGIEMVTQQFEAVGFGEYGEDVSVYVKGELFEEKRLSFRVRPGL